MTHFDYIIIGAGAAGLMLADALGKDSFFSKKTILLLDKDSKRTNDRTWCFWEKGNGKFDTILDKTWNHIYFGGQEFSGRFDIVPYSYKMVRGVDFYSEYLYRIRAHSNITFKNETVVNINDSNSKVVITTNNNTYTAQQIFNSIFNYEMVTHQKKYPVLQQHFVGWFVKTQKPLFDKDQVTYMDFSIEQKGNTRFMYVLPTSEYEALIEYTLFSEDLLTKEEYEAAIKDYLENSLSCVDYEIMETEMGSIPMTCYDFKKENTKNVFNIGTAGGWAKPSTGYTFMSTSKKIPRLLEHLKSGKTLDLLTFKNKFWFYDLLFLDVLHKDNGNGHRIFESLFKNRNPQLIFKFLDEETSFWEDINYIWGCPKKPFIKAFFKRLF